MPQIPPPVSDILDFISKQVVITVPILMNHFNRSRATIFRFLNQIEHITSYNQNRTGITLHKTPKYDSWGLWKYQQYYFSKWETLNETIQNIVDKSHAGFYPRELHELLGVRIHNHLSLCVTEGRIIRNDDFKHPVYFSKMPETRRRQFEVRQDIFKKRFPIETPPLSNENVIKVLVVIIKHRATSVNKAMRALASDGYHFSRQSIEWLFKKYAIEKKGSP